MTPTIPTYQTDFDAVLEKAIERAHLLNRIEQQQFLYRWLGSEIKKQRRKTKLSFAQLKKRSGINKSDWLAYENADEVPDLFEFALMCRAVNLLIDFRTFYLAPGEQIFVA